MKRCASALSALSVTMLALVSYAGGRAPTGKPFEHFSQKPAWSFPGPYVTAVRNTAKKTALITFTGVYHGPPATVMAEAVERVPAKTLNPKAAISEQVVVDADPATPSEPVESVEDGDDITFAMEVPLIDKSNALGFEIAFRDADGNETLVRQKMSKQQ